MNLKETEYEGENIIHLVHDNKQWRSFVNTATNLQHYTYTRNLLASLENTGSIWRILHHGDVSYLASYLVSHSLCLCLQSFSSLNVRIDVKLAKLQQFMLF